MKDATSAVPGIISRLNERGVVPTGLTVSRPTLDDVFLSATGARLGEETGETEMPVTIDSSKNESPRIAAAK